MHGSSKCIFFICLMYYIFSTPLENSPVSDTKMDISESATTISQDSPVTSPDIRENSVSDSGQITNARSTDVQSDSNINTTITSKSSTNAFNSVDADNNDEKACLDNRLDVNTALESLTNRDVTSSVMSRSGFTLANSHPLMSPLNSEGSPDSLGQNNFSYPDVVPDHEPLRLVNPKPTTSDSQPPINQRPNLSLDVVSDNSLSDIFNEKEIGSDESEPDLSQYQASVEPTFQSVSLIAHSSSNKMHLTPKQNTRRKIPVSSELLSGDDVSSVETFSNNSHDNTPFDDDMNINDAFNIDPNLNSSNLVSASVSSSLLANEMSTTVSMTKMNLETDKDGEVIPAAPSEPIPQYSAMDETRDSRNWQKIVLPNGKMREIDMKVIEPYKRVLSHGGYLKAGGHNAIVVFSACYLPDRSRMDYHYVMDNLFL